jgi:hypothetical protein
MPTSNETAVALTNRNTDLIPAPTFSPDTPVTVNKEALKEAPRSALNICLEYHEFEIGQPVRGIFLGLTPYKCADKQSGEEVVLTGAVFVDENGSVKINCAVKFVTTLSMFGLKTAFEATFTRTKKTGNGGNMQLFDIRPLAYNEKK